VKKFHITAEKQREDAERKCVLQINVVCVRMKEGREKLNFLGFDENVKNTFIFLKNQGQFCIFS